MVRSGFAPAVSGFSALPVLRSVSLLPSRQSHAQPEPNCVAPAAANCFLNSSYEPKLSLIMSAILPVGCPPPFGDSEFQKKVWFHTWAALLNTPALSGLPAVALMISTIVLDLSW